MLRNPGSVLHGVTLGFRMRHLIPAEVAMTDVGSAIPRRQLGRQLRALRDGAGVTADELAAELGWHRSKVWRIETGQSPVVRSDVLSLTQVLKASSEMREVLLALSAESRNKGWWHSRGDAIPDWFEMYVSFETAADRIRTYASDALPGLLQTADYARAVYRAASEDSDEEVERRVQLRIDRQSLLTRESPSAPRFDVIINESLLRSAFGGAAVMRRQLAQLILWTDLPNVTIRVLPFAAGAHAGTEGTFVLLSFPEAFAEPDLVYVEGATGALYLDKPKELARYGFIMRDLTTRSLDPERSREFIEATAKEW
ncbi:helix-turn-helix domain-containing protein [Actinocatenispora sera]|nr:helix-turn-helix transcriptional regulator [Actinocatenispora sera]